MMHTDQLEPAPDKPALLAAQKQRRTEGNWRILAASLAIMSVILVQASPVWAQIAAPQEAPEADDDACFIITGPVRFGLQRRLIILAKQNQVEGLVAKGYEQIDCRGYEQTVTEIADQACTFDKDGTAEAKTAFQNRFGIEASELCKITGNKKLKVKKQDSYGNWLEKKMR